MDFCVRTRFELARQEPSVRLRQFCRLQTIIEDQPVTGKLSPIIQKQLMFPYQPRTLRLLRWVMRRLY